MSAPELPWSIRAGLRLLPRSYREHRTAEIQATVADAGDAGRISVGAEAIALVALSIRVRGRSLLAPPSTARTRAAVITATTLPILLLIPAARAVTLSIPSQPAAWIWNALVPGWIAAVFAGPLTLFGASRWAHRFSMLAVVLFVAGLLALVSTTNVQTAVREFGWLPLLATSAALNRDPQRVRDGRRLLGTTGLAIVAAIAAGAAVVYVAVGPLWSISLPAPLDSVFYNGRLVFGGVLVAICLAGLASRAARAALPVVAALGMFYVGATLESKLWGNSDREYLTSGSAYLPVGHLVLQMVVIPLVVFAAARALTALVDRSGRAPDMAPLTR